MKGSLIFERQKKLRTDMELIKLYTALERKMTIIDRDYDDIYYRHYQFKAEKKRAQQLEDSILKFKTDLLKYEEIFKRIKKYYKDQDKKRKEPDE